MLTLERIFCVKREVTMVKWIYGVKMVIHVGSLLLRIEDIGSLNTRNDHLLFDVRSQESVVE